MRARKKLDRNSPTDEVHIGNTTEPSVCGGDAAFCQITLTTCYYSIHRVSYKRKITNLATCGIQMSSQRQKQLCHQHQETAVHCRVAVFHSTLTHLINRLQPLHTAHTHTQETATFSWCVTGFFLEFLTVGMTARSLCIIMHNFVAIGSNRSWDMAIFSTLSKWRPSTILDLLWASLDNPWGYLDPI